MNITHMKELGIKSVLGLQPLVGSGAVSFIGGNATEPTTSKWYKSLKQSKLTPPSYVFPIVWPILYVLLGLNAVRMYTALGSTEFIKSYFPTYEVQLLLNFSWSIAFFTFKNPVVSLGIIGGMILLTIALIMKSWDVDRIAGYALLPYIGWIAFASYLNYFIVVSNNHA